MPLTGSNTFKGNFEYQLRLYRPDWTKFFQGVIFHEMIHLCNLLISKPGIGFCKTDKFVSIPYCKSVICIQVTSPPMSFLGVYHDGIDDQRIYLPFPPIAGFPSYLVRR